MLYCHGVQGDTVKVLSSVDSRVSWFITRCAMEPGQRARDTRRAQVDADTGANIRLLLGKCQVQSVVARYLDE